jgi:hypothetical protein
MTKISSGSMLQKKLGMELKASRLSSRNYAANKPFASSLTLFFSKNPIRDGG